MMTTRQAVDIVNQYGADWNLPSLLDTVEQMDAAFKADELTTVQRQAYLIFIDEMKNLVGAY